MTYTVRARRPDGGNRTCQAAPATIIVPSAWDTLIDEDTLIDDQINIVPYLGLAAPVLAAAGGTASPYLAVTAGEVFGASAHVMLKQHVTSLPFYSSCTLACV